MIPTIGLQPIQILIPVMVEDAGVERPDWTQPPAQTVDLMASVQPASTVEPMAGRDNTQTEYHVWMDRPAGDWPQYSRIRIPALPGRDWDIVGEGQTWTSITGLLDHMELTIRRAEG